MEKKKRTDAENVDQQNYRGVSVDRADNDVVDQCLVEQDTRMLNDNPNNNESSKGQ